MALPKVPNPAHNNVPNVNDYLSYKCFMPAKPEKFFATISVT